MSLPITLEMHTRSWHRAGARAAPGLLVCAAIAAVSMGIKIGSGWAALSPLILSITIGMLIRNLASLPASLQAGLHAGIGFSVKRLLRAGIVLLGLQVTAQQILSLGAGGLTAIVATLIATFVAIRLMGRLMRIDPALTDLIAAGTAICGASAVIATNTVVRGRQEHVAYAIACVTLFGSLSMLFLPMLAQPLGLDARAYGLWSGASIHEVAQVVAAAFQGGDVAGHFGVVAKLARVLMLAPMVAALALSLRRGPQPGNADGADGTGKRGGTVPLPWFVLGFVALMAVNSLITIPAGLTDGLAALTNVLLAMALAAMGLQTDIRKLAAEGFRPLLLGAFGWLFIAVLGYALLRLLTP